MSDDDVPRRPRPPGSRRAAADDTAIMLAVGDVLGRPRSRRPRWDSFVLLTIIGVMAIIALLGVIVAGRAKEPPRSAAPNTNWVPPAPFSSALPVPVEIAPAAASTAPATAQVRQPAQGRTPSAVDRPAGGGTVAATTPTVAPPRPVPRLVVGSRISLESADAPGFRMRHDGERMRLDPVGPDSDADARADASFTVLRGMADPRCVSLASVDQPGRYVRHRNFTLYLERGDDSGAFAADATFCPVPATVTGALLLRSENFPDRFADVNQGRLFLHRMADGDITAFRVRPAL